MKRKSHNVPVTSHEANQQANKSKLKERHEKSIVTFLEANQDYSYSATQMAAYLNLTAVQISRRIRKIIRSGKVKVARNVKQGGRKVQLYQYNKSGIPQKDKPSRFEKLKEVVKENVPEELYKDIMQIFNIETAEKP